MSFCFEYIFIYIYRASSREARQETHMDRQQAEPSMLVLLCAVMFCPLVTHGKGGIVTPAQMAGKAANAMERVGA